MGDWYRLRLSDLEQNSGWTLSHYWRASPIEGVKECYPRYRWQEWLSVQVPHGFWDARANRCRYMQWSGNRLGYSRPDNWYGVTCGSFRRNHGQLLERYGNSAVRAVMDLIPRRHWYEWKFRRVPKDFWEQADDRHRYIQWLGRRLRFRRPEDWYRIRCDDLRGASGGRSTEPV